MAADIELAGRHANGRTLLAGAADLLLELRRIFRQRHAEAELNGLTDRYLRDIGIERTQISETVAREISRTSLGELGWRNRPAHWR